MSTFVTPARIEAILFCKDLPAAYLKYLVTGLNLPLFYVLGNHDEATRMYRGFEALKLFDKQHGPRYHFHGHTLVRKGAVPDPVPRHPDHQHQPVSDAGHMSLFDSRPPKEAASRTQADAAFSRAMSRGLVRELKDQLLRRSKALLPFDEVKEKLELWYGRDIGRQTVPLDAIVGSQGRYRNFSRHFLPLDENLRQRWKEIEMAVAAGRDLPPVELYKVCNAYFVKDGHHRISVAKAKQRTFIEARVFEYTCDLSLDDKTDLEQIVILETYHRFLKDTGLKDQRSPNLHLTVLGGYPILMEHIQRHKLFLEKKQGRSVGIKEAAVSWYDNIYSPMRRLIVENDILRHFPHRTEADFYIWISKYKNHLLLDEFKPEQARSEIDNYYRLFSRPARKLWGRLRRFLGLVRY
jgi:hypothetical protein